MPTVTRIARDSLIFLTDASTFSFILATAILHQTTLLLHFQLTSFATSPSFIGCCWTALHPSRNMIATERTGALVLLPSPTFSLWAHHKLQHTIISKKQCYMFLAEKFISTHSRNDNPLLHPTPIFVHSNHSFPASK
ncbi:unnamed protein product [Cuscuta epithymum]|uniref:Uncharacterized protein n=1 Tax=Cuscuta epithymum TaxID=186058 RepID=A0AAV0F0A6_9ASTE|nr:unnamed protein product [Cuscuta epithymum]